MCYDKFERQQIKRGAGLPTIPASTDHRNGDWLATDIYEGELYMNTNTGQTYSRIGSTIITADNKKPYLIWKALITQSGTSAPTLTVVENTLGVTITPSRVSIGFYELSGFSGNLTAGNCEIHSNFNHIGDEWFMQQEALTDSVLTVVTYETGTGVQDSILNGIGNSITVYVY